MPADWTPLPRRRWVRRGDACVALLFFALSVTGCADHRHLQPLKGFAASPYFDEQIREAKLQPDTRVLIDAPAPAQIDKRRPTRLIIYALPNGNTIEQTFGARKAPGLDWHYDIQHIAAQTRRLRELDRTENIVIAYVEAGEKSWPTWRSHHPHDVRSIVK